LQLAGAPSHELIAPSRIGTGTPLPKFAATLLSRENIGDGRRAHRGLILNTLIDAEIDGTPNRF
jgi:hypothetical protein